MTQMVKRLPAMWETQVQSLGWEDPLEKDVATHSSILARRIPWTEEPGVKSPRGHKESNTTEQLTILSSNSAPRYLPEVLYTNVHGNFDYNCQSL